MDGFSSSDAGCLLEKNLEILFQLYSEKMQCFLITVETKRTFLMCHRKHFIRKMNLTGNK